MVAVYIFSILLCVSRTLSVDPYGEHWSDIARYVEPIVWPNHKLYADFLTSTAANKSLKLSEECATDISSLSEGMTTYRRWAIDCKLFISKLKLFKTMSP